MISPFPKPHLPGAQLLELLARLHAHKAAADLALLGGDALKAALADAAHHLVVLRVALGKHALAKVAGVEKNLHVLLVLDPNTVLGKHALGACWVRV